MQQSQPDRGNLFGLFTLPQQGCLHSQSAQHLLLLLLLPLSVLQPPWALSTGSAGDMAASLASSCSVPMALSSSSTTGAACAWLCVLGTRHARGRVRIVLNPFKTHTAQGHTQALHLHPRSHLYPPLPPPPLHTYTCTQHTTGSTALPFLALTTMTQPTTLSLPLLPVQRILRWGFNKVSGWRSLAMQVPVGL